MPSKLTERDLAHIWHPCSQMKDYESFPPLEIVKAEGSYLYTADGREIIDAISSWWCKSLGHSHPRILEAVKNQLTRFEHVIMANTCNRTLVELSERLSSIFPGMDKVFYADNGSTAVEIAIKMSLQYNLQTGHPEKKHFLALKNGYHGETILTLAAGDCELYSSPYAELMPKIVKIDHIPYVSGENDCQWENMSDEAWELIEEQIEQYSETLSGIIFEPVVQGAGGMKIYSPDLLKRLRKWCDKFEVHIIADEIMTGFGRTGKFMACDHAGIIPDFVCLSKGLTAGWGPMAAVLTSSNIYEAFYDDYRTGKAFMHSNTYCGYPLAAAAALEALKVYDDENTFNVVRLKSCELRKRMEDIAKSTSALINIRSIGFIAAADIVNPETGKPFPAEKRMGFKFYQNAVKLGALLRPLGDTIYFFPPLNTPDKVLDDLASIAEKALNSTLF